MEMLPPTGWADVATKQDLEHLVTKGDLHREITRLIMWLVPLNATLAFGAAQLAR